MPQIERTTKASRIVSGEVAETIDNRMARIITDLEDEVVNIEKTVKHCQTALRNIALTQRQWRGELGRKVRMIRRAVFQFDKILNPDKYRRAEKTQIKYDDETRFDINGQIVK